MVKEMAREFNDSFRVFLFYEDDRASNFQITRLCGSIHRLCNAILWWVGSAIPAQTDFVRNLLDVRCDFSLLFKRVDHVLKNLDAFWYSQVNTACFQSTTAHFNGSVVCVHRKTPESLFEVWFDVIGNLIRNRIIWSARWIMLEVNMFICVDRNCDDCEDVFLAALTLHDGHEAVSCSANTV